MKSSIYIFMYVSVNPKQYKYKYTDYSTKSKLRIKKTSIGQALWKVNNKGNQ